MAATDEELWDELSPFTCKPRSQPRFYPAPSVCPETPPENAFHPPYHRPALSLFNEHIRAEIAPVDKLRTHVTGEVTAIDPVDDRFDLTVATSTGTTESVPATTVILAVGNPPPHIPEPFRSLRNADIPIFHVYDAAFDIDAIPPTSRVAIVGGGIAGAHLALNLQRRGVAVDIWNRDPFYPAQFDSDPCFIGPRCGDDFREHPFSARRTIITNSRRPGSVPPDLFEAITAAHRNGDIEILTTEVHAGNSRNDRWIRHARSKINTGSTLRWVAFPRIRHRCIVHRLCAGPTGRAP